MPASVIQPSFSAGEVSPTLFGRVDLAKYKVGAKTMRNFFVDYRGGASNRAGTRFVGQALFSSLPTRLIPFKFSTLQTYVLEFGDYYMRVIKDGAYVLETEQTITGITAADPAVVTCAGHGYFDGDWVYLSVAGMTRLNQRFFVVSSAGTNTFQLTDLFGNVVDSSTYAAFTSGTVAQVYTIGSPYAAADLEMVKYFQSADKLTLCHPDYAPQDLTRTGHAAWSFTPISFYAAINPPSGLTGTPSSAGTAYFSYTVTTVSAAGEESVAATPFQFQGVNITTTSGSNRMAWSAVANAEYYNIYRAIVSPNTDIPIGATHGYVGMTYGLEFVDSNITPDYTKTPPTHQNPFAQSAIASATVSTGGSAYVSSTTSITVADATGSGAILIPIIVGGVLVGVVVQDGGSGYTSPTLSVVGAGTGATANATLGPATGTYPSTGCYFQQRKMFAASDNAPQTLWGTQPGAYTNMDKSIPTTDGDALNLTLASTQVNNIKFMLPMPGGLVILTGGGAWQATGNGQQNSALTPSSANAVPQAYNGCADLPPIVVSYDILYVQNKGSIVRDLSYNFFSNIYTGIDISALSNHLFNAYDLVDWAFAEEPFKMVWVVRSDGELLSLTFVKEQEVFGWARHDTQGQFKSVAVVQEGNEDVAYFIVSRYVQGQWLQYVERMASRLLDINVAPELTAENTWFLDCALEYAVNEPAATLAVSAATGTTVLIADAIVFSADDVGKVFRGGGGKGTVTEYVNEYVIVVELTSDIQAVIPDDETNTPLPIESGAWSLQTLTDTVSGLEHLEGKTVKVVADGNVFPDVVVSDGAVTLPVAASLIVVGLAYDAQLETLNLDTQAGAGGSIQGKRKKIAATTVRVDNTRGIAVGPTFDTLYDFKETIPPVIGQAKPLYTGDQRINMSPQWNVEGRVCIQLNYPMPCTVLAVIPEVELGDVG